MTFSDFLARHKGKKTVVCGVGISNRPLIRLLRQHGCEVEARDRKSLAELGPAGDELRELGVVLISGENYLENIDADYVYRSPGLHPDALRDAKGKITSEMEAFFDVCPCKIIAVTGSDGKTTTSTIVAEILKADGKSVWLGGNIGTPLLDKTPEMSPDDWVVVELSSFQLITMERCADIAIVTNVTPNHLDIHRSLEEYIDAKRRVYLHGDGRVVLNLENEVTKGFGSEIGDRAVWFSLAKKNDHAWFDGSSVYMSGRCVLNAQDVRIPGLHNIDNYMAAIAALDGFVSDESIRKVAREFGGVEHRIEFVRELDGVRYYNDSMSSSPTRTLAGLKAFNHKVVLIVGGYDKHIPFDPLTDVLAAHVSSLILIGATAAKIRAAAEKVDGCPPITDANTLSEAVNLARQSASDGGVVLFSPACASFDMFKNFADRGDTFRRIVAGLQPKD